MIRITAGQGGLSGLDDRVKARLGQMNCSDAPGQRPKIAVACEMMRHKPAAGLHLYAVDIRRQRIRQR
jgi:hypothetical protein